MGPANTDDRDLDGRIRGPELRLSAHHPADLRRSQRAGPGDAVHPEQHRHDPARLRPVRLDFDAIPAGHFDQPDVTRDRAIDRPEPAAVGLPAAQADAREHAAAPNVLQLRRRGHGSLRLHRRGQLRPQPRSLCATGDAGRPRTRPLESGEPQQRQLELGQPAPRLHPRHRAGHAAGQRGRAQFNRPECQPAAGHPERSARLVARRPGGHSTAHLLRHPDERLRHRRRRYAGIRLSVGDHHGRRLQQLVRHDGHQARHAADQAAVRRPIRRPEPAHQQPGERQQSAADAAFDPGARPADRAIPALRQGPVPGRDRQRQARLCPRRLHHHGQLPGRQRLQPGQRLSSERPGGRSVQLHSE